MTHSGHEKWRRAGEMLTYIFDWNWHVQKHLPGWCSCELCAPCIRKLRSNLTPWRGLLISLANSGQLGTWISGGFPAFPEKGDPLYLDYEYKPCSLCWNPLSFWEFGTSVHTCRVPTWSAPKKNPAHWSLWHSLVGNTSHVLSQLSAGWMTSALCDLTGKKLWKLAPGFLQTSPNVPFPFAEFATNQSQP